LELTHKRIKKHIQEAKLGNQSAFSFLLDTYWNEVYGFVLKRVQDEYEAEDIAIETFSKAFDRISTYNEEFQFNTWLIAISKNIQIDKSRKKNASLHAQRKENHEDHANKIVDDALSPVDQLIKEQNLNELLGFIKLLKPHYQEVINLRYFREMSYNEISTTLNEPLNNVKVRLLRARKLLSELIHQKLGS